MKIQNLTPGGYAANCYLVSEGTTAVLIDCTANAKVITEALEKAGARLAAILLTHGHFDHMLTVEAVKAATGAQIILAEGDGDLPGDAKKNAFSVFFRYEHTYPKPDRLITDGDTLTFGDLTLTVIGTPGHTRGSVVYLMGDIAFTGDTLFASGFGRYDLYGGDVVALQHSLLELEKLPRSTVIYPGHGECAALGEVLDMIKGY